MALLWTWNSCCEDASWLQWHKSKICYAFKILIIVSYVCALGFILIRKCFIVKEICGYSGKNLYNW